MFVGLGASRFSSRPAPSRPPAATIGTSVLPTPLADSEALVFAQPLSAGCATAGSVWVVSDGGGMGRFVDGRRSLVDATLRSLVAVACAATEAIAVGPAGRVVTADIDLGTACTVRSVFVRGTEVWFVASDGTRAAVWRQDQSGLRRWGGC